MTTTPTRTASPTTKALIAEALEHHRQAEEACRDMHRASQSFLTHAAEAGRVLNALRAAHKGRDWMAWADVNLPDIGRSTRNNYMQLATNWERLRPRLQADPTLSLRGALRLLRDDNEVEPTHAAAVLRVLDSVAFGLAPNSIVEHSDHFIFRGGEVWACDGGSLCCRAPNLLGCEIQGAVHGRALLRLLEQFTDEQDVRFTAEGNWLTVAAERKAAAIQLVEEVCPALWTDLPEEVGEPADWEALPEHFAEAVRAVAPCASRWYVPPLNCVHIQPEWIEACDGHTWSTPYEIYSLARYTIRTGFTKSVLIRSDSLRQVVSLGMTETGVTEGWVHFRNRSGLVVSCPQETGEYADLGEALTLRGTEVPLPRKLREAAEAAAICVRGERSAPTKLMVKLEAGKLEITGAGPGVQFTETLPIKYGGPALEFRIPAEELVAIARRFTHCEIAPRYVKCIDGNFTLMVSLSPPPETPEGGENATTGEEPPRPALLPPVPKPPPGPGEILESMRRSLRGSCNRQIDRLRPWHLRFLERKRGLDLGFLISRWRKKADAALAAWKARRKVDACATTERPTGGT